MQQSFCIYTAVCVDDMIRPCDNIIIALWETERIKKRDDLLSHHSQGEVQFAKGVARASLGDEATATRRAQQDAGRSMHDAPARVHQIGP